MVEMREVDGFLSRHRRHRCLPWRCRCGLPHPCGARRTALDELTRRYAREAEGWYRDYYRRTGHAG